MTTTISLMYRDGSNYKQTCDVTFAGEITDTELALLKGALNQDGGDDLGSIICAQVNVEGPEFDSVSDDDHCWTEVTYIEITGNTQTDDRHIAEFVADVVAASEAGWDEIKYDPVRKLAEGRGLVPSVDARPTASELWQAAAKAEGAAVVATLVELAEQITNEHPDAAYLWCVESDEGSDLRADALLNADDIVLDVDVDDIDPDLTLGMLDDGNRTWWADFDTSVRHRRKVNHPRFDLRAILATRTTTPTEANHG